MGCSAERALLRLHFGGGSERWGETEEFQLGRVNSRFCLWERDFQDVKLGRSEEGKKRKEGQRQMKDRREAVG